MIASFSVVTRFGRRWLLPVLLIQSVLLLGQDTRLEDLIAGLILLCVLSRYGMRLTRKQIGISLGILFVIFLDITATRPTDGGTRANADYVTGLSHLFSPSTRANIATTLGYRLDGVIFLDASFNRGV